MMGFFGAIRLRFLPLAPGGARPLDAKAPPVLRAVPLVLLLAGCGFQPLYGEHGTQHGLPPIAVAPLAERSGQILHNALLDELGTGAAPDARYRLTVTPELRVVGSLFNRDATTERSKLLARGDWELRDETSGQIAARGAVTTQVSYNIVSAQYATLAIEEAAQERGLRALARLVAQDVALYFSRRGQSAPR